MMLSATASGRGPLRAQSSSILLVDDDAAVRGILAETLAESGHRVVQAAGGVEALEAIEQYGDLQVLITDVRMPGLSGLELADMALSARRDLRIILISGFFLPRPVRFRLLKKPFHTHQLLAAIAAELA